MEPTTYFHHVDGLRAVAIVVVLLFHLDVRAFKNGYLGVDWFFVISGFLISRQLVEELSANGSINFSRFYIRRVRRLFPAFLATCYVSTIVALALLSPTLLATFAHSLTFTALSLSNIFFWRTSGYFETLSTLQPLLHTWSLSIEEQFYIIWPSLLLLLYKLKLPRTVSYIGLLTLSIALNVFWGHFKPDTNYQTTMWYLVPFRLYEFVGGAIASELCNSKVPKSQTIQYVLLASGLLLNGISLLFYKTGIVFPYIWAIPPTIGTALIILYGNLPPLSWILTNFVTKRVGRASYSVYLVHWPLLVFYRYYVFRRLILTEKIGLFVGSLVCGEISHALIENRFRFKSKNIEAAAAGRRIVLLIFLAVCALILIAQGVFSLSSNRGDYFLSANNVDRRLKERHPWYNTNRDVCYLPNVDTRKACNMSKKVQVMIYGDSHEDDAFNAFNEMYRDHKDVNLIGFGQVNHCALRVRRGRPVSLSGKVRCSQRLEQIGPISRRLSIVVVSFYRYLDFKCPEMKPIWHVLHYMLASNPDLKFVVLSHFFRTDMPCAEIIGRFSNFGSCFQLHNQDFNPFAIRAADVAYLAKEQKILNFTYINKTKLFCNGTSWETCEIEAFGEPYSYDRHHLSLGYARLLGRRIGQVYGKELVQIGLPPPLYSENRLWPHQH
jgi:peptidoglycan/LPS O-acetylase OafA/YrhL